MSNGWPEVPIEETLQLQRRWIKLEPDALYTEVGVRSFGKGIFQKSPVTGLSLGNKRVLRICPGDLVFNNVFAWEGAVGVASEGEAGTIGSHRFVTYTINDNRADARFLQLFFRTKPGLDVLRHVSPGSAGRNRTLNLDQFAKQKVPLPPLPEQRRIVARVDELAAKIEAAKNLRQSADLESASLLSSARLSIFSSNHGWRIVTLGEVADIVSGVTLGRDLRGATIEMPYLRVANVQDGHLDLSVIKTVRILESEKDKWLLARGDLLLTEGGDWDKLGRGTVWMDEIPGSIHQNHIFRLRVKPCEFDPFFLSALIGSPYGKSYFQAASKQTTNLASINQRQLKAFPVYQPPLAEQRRVVAYLDNLQANVDSLKALQAQTQAELDALQPSILDKAFKGEL
jgi:type I restriction enzyme S subunit